MRLCSLLCCRVPSTAGDIPLAIKKWKRALAILEASHASDPFHVFEAQFALGDLYDENRDPTAALVYYEQVRCRVRQAHLRPHSSGSLTRAAAASRHSLHAPGCMRTSGRGGSGGSRSRSSSRWCRTASHRCTKTGEHAAVGDGTGTSRR